MSAEAPYDRLARAVTRHDTIARPPLPPVFVTKFACMCGFSTDWFLTDNVILAENEMRRHETSCAFGPQFVTR